MNIKAVLFDLDGVLLDTEGTYTEFWADVDRRHPTGVENFAQVIKGSTLAKIYERYFPDETIQAEITRDLREFEDSMPFIMYEGALELLSQLRERSIATAIVTSSNRVKMARVMSELPQLAALIDTLVTDEDVERSKPDPEGYILAAKRLNAYPEAFVVVEDSINGLHAGRASGGRVTGLATTNPREAIEPLADIVVDTIAYLTAEILTR